MSTAAKKYGPASRDHLVTPVATPPKLKSARAASVDSADNSSRIGQLTSDFLVPAGTIRRFAEIDLGEVENLPGRCQDLIALSIRVEAAFRDAFNSVFALIAEEHEDLPRGVFEKLASNVALDFIERYGVLALFSTSVLGLLWEAQRPKSQNGPKRLQEAGTRLATFAIANKGVSPKKTIDIVFTLRKPLFLAELQQLSRELGALRPNESRADQMLKLVATGKYEMLENNQRLLEQFLRSQVVNPYLRAKNENAVARLARYGGLLELGDPAELDKVESMTPDWFFYTWIAWVVNKTPKTVRREIQTAEKRLKHEINRLVQVTKNR